MAKAHFIPAMGSPLTDDEQLHEGGLEVHIHDQLNAGMSELLLAGTMGAMQLLTDDTYRRLVRRAVEIVDGEAEILIGAGDAGLARSLERISFLNQLPISGVAVLCPFFWKFPQAELIVYFKALADASRAPVYLYDLPQVVGTKLEMATILELQKHPNIKGAKVSCDFEFTRRLIDLVDDSFRIVVAQPNLVDVLLRHGVYEQLDGMWSIAPKWTVSIGDCAAEGDWDAAADYQQRITALRNLLPKYGFAGFSGMMNARGIPGHFAPLPFTRLSEAKRSELEDEPILRKLVEENPAAAR